MSTAIPGAAEVARRYFLPVEAALRDMGGDSWPYAAHDPIYPGECAVWSVPSITRLNVRREARGVLPRCVLGGVPCVVAARVAKPSWFAVAVRSTWADEKAVRLIPVDVNILRAIAVNVAHHAPAETVVPLLAELTPDVLDAVTATFYTTGSLDSARAVLDASVGPLGPRLRRRAQ